MKEFVEKLIERLEEETYVWNDGYRNGIKSAITIVKQLAEEYNNISTDISTEQLDLSTRIADDLSKVLKEAESMGCKEVKYFHHVPLENVEIVIKALRAYNSNLSGNSIGWIPCGERLPEDGDNRFYMCIVENHEEDVPMFCQYCEDHGFGFWHDFYDEHTLGFLDSEFKTNEELGYEKVIAWQPLPEPYKPEEPKQIPTDHYTERFNRVM